jgi:hypothetical protein
MRSTTQSFAHGEVDLEKARGLPPRKLLHALSLLTKLVVFVLEPFDLQRQLRHLQISFVHLPLTAIAPVMPTGVQLRLFKVVELGVGVIKLLLEFGAREAISARSVQCDAERAALERAIRLSASSLQGASPGLFACLLQAFL